MSFPVNFYILYKRLNSTKRPDSDTAGVTYNCNLLDDCSIINPRIAIVGANNTFNPRQYNYATIPSFDRWYFVSEWVYSAGVWTANLSEDVLASWKNGIGNSKQYITRSSVAVSNNLIDGRYPATTTAIKVTDNFSSPFVSSRDFGTYIVSILGNGADLIGYYALNRINYVQFAQSLFGADGVWQQLINDLVDPLQYIISVRWFPVDYISFSETEKDILFIGYKPVRVTYKPLDSYSWRGSCNIKLTEHPQTGERGPWVNSGPYTKRCIYWPPVGEIPLNCIDITYNVINNIRAMRLEMTFTLDIPSGMGNYRIINDGVTIASGPCKLAVDLPLAGQQVDFGGVLSGSLQTIGSTLSDNVTGAVSGIVNGIKSTFPQVMSRGSTGSITVYTEKPVCISTFYYLANSAVNVYGWPAMFEDFIDAYPGYLEVEKPVISLPATDWELGQIESFMKGGFYYE